MSWSAQLERAQFRGVEFDCQTTRDSHERRIAEYTYPGVDGVDDDDLGRMPRRCEVKAIFTGADYLAQLGALLEVIDEGKPGRWRHPLLGGYTARIRRGSVEHDQARRESATVDLEIVESGTRAPLETVFSVEAIKREVTIEAEAVEAAVAELAVDVDEVTSALDSVTSFVESAEQQVADIEQRVNEVRSRIDNAVAAVRAKVDELKAHPAVRAARRLAHACQRLGDRVQRLRPRIRSLELSVTGPIALLAHRLYGDASRGDELARLNNVRNPFLVRGGQEVQVYGE